MIDGLEILEDNSSGYHPLVKYEGWRVAVATLCDNWTEGKVSYVERQMETDEVFVLLKGKCTLLIGQDRKRCEMETGKVYNVKKAVWHNMILDEEGLVLIVENDNTSRDNTEYYYF